MLSALDSPMPDNVFSSSFVAVFRCTFPSEESADDEAIVSEKPPALYSSCVGI